MIQLIKVTAPADYVEGKLDKEKNTVFLNNEYFYYFFILITKILLPHLLSLSGFSLKMVSQLFQGAEHNLGMEMNCSRWGMN